jgi:hypothetical protein
VAGGFIGLGVGAAPLMAATPLGWTGVAIAVGSGFVVGAGINAIRQHAEMADGTRDHFSWQDFVLSGMMGAAMAPGFAMFPWVTFPLASGMGLISGVREASQGHGWTAATDITAAVFPWLMRPIRSAVFSGKPLIATAKAPLAAPLAGNPTANPGNPFPANAQAGQTFTNINPNTLQAGRGDLVAGRLATQQQLIQQGTPRTTPIKVTPDGVIWDGNHGARAAAQVGVPVTVEVIQLPPGIPPPVGRGPVTNLPIRPGN